MFGARFDDAAAGRSFSLVEPLGEIVAVQKDDVEDAIRCASSESANGRWVAGYVTYDAAPAFDNALTVSELYDGPLVWFGVFGDKIDIDPALADPMAADGFSVSRWVPTQDAERYDAAFAAVRSYIKHGDTYQVNLTFPLRSAFSGLAENMYSSLVAAQQPAYAAHIWHGDTHVLSVSPERFFVVSDGRITTRPMKGTARRGRWTRSEERRVGKECRARWSPYH